MQIHLKYTNTIFCLVACTKKLSKVTILFDLIILLLIWIQGVRTNDTKNLTPDEEKVGGKDLVGLGVTLRCLARLSQPRYKSSGDFEVNIFQKSNN